VEDRRVKVLNARSFVHAEGVFLGKPERACQFPGEVTVVAAREALVGDETAIMENSHG